MAKNKVKKKSARKLTLAARFLKIFSYFTVGALLLFTYQNCSGGGGGSLNFGSSGGTLTVSFLQNPYSGSVNTDIPITASVSGGSGTYPSITWSTPNSVTSCAPGNVVCVVKYASANSYTPSVFVTDSKGAMATANALVNVTAGGGGGGGGGGTGTLSVTSTPYPPTGDANGNAQITLAWTSNVSNTKICVSNVNCCHVGMPYCSSDVGSYLTGGGANGSATTGLWTKNGTIFYLQDASNNAVLSSFTATVTAGGGGGGGSCIQLVACVDGTDFFALVGSTFSHQHTFSAQVGTHSSCPASAKVAGGGYYLDGVSHPADSSFPVSMTALQTYTKVSGRGQIGANGPNGFYIDDPTNGADVYTVNICP